jgi:hypothetical protein
MCIAAAHITCPYVHQWMMWKHAFLLHQKTGLWPSPALCGNFGQRLFAFAPATAQLYNILKLVKMNSCNRSYFCNALCWNLTHSIIIIVVVDPSQLKMKFTIVILVYMHECPEDDHVIG